MGTTEDDPIVLSYHDSLLKQSDVDLLSGPNWLNDQLISFYFEYLSQDVYKDDGRILFVSPEVTQCLKMVSPGEVEMFLGPVNAREKQIIFLCTERQCPKCGWGLALVLVGVVQASRNVLPFRFILSGQSLCRRGATGQIESLPGLSQVDARAQGGQVPSTIQWLRLWHSCHCPGRTPGQACH